MKILEVVDLRSFFFNCSKNINFVLSKGDFLLLIGRNGSGKTTLIETILKIRKARSGKVIFNTKEISFMMQKDIFNTTFPIVVKDLINFSLYSRRRTSIFPIKKETLSIANTISKNLLIDDLLLGKNLVTLSGGERQRIKLALSILEKPKLLILDEPFNNTDKASYQRMINEIHYQNNILNTTIILISHTIPKSISGIITSTLEIKENGCLLQTNRNGVEKQ